MIFTIRILIGALSAWLNKAFEGASYKQYHGHR